MTAWTRGPKIGRLMAALPSAETVLEIVWETADLPPTPFVLEAFTFEHGVEVSELIIIGSLRGSVADVAPGGRGAMMTAAKPWMNRTELYYVEVPDFDPSAAGLVALAYRRWREVHQRTEVERSEVRTALLGAVRVAVGENVAHRELARACGVDISVVTRWIRDLGIPADKARSRAGRRGRSRARG